MLRRNKLDLMSEKYKFSSAQQVLEDISLVIFDRNIGSVAQFLTELLQILSSETFIMKTYTY